MRTRIILNKNFKPKEIKELVRVIDKDHMLRVVIWENNGNGPEFISNIYEFSSDRWSASNRLYGITSFIRSRIPENVNRIEICLVCLNHEHINITGCPHHEEDN